MSSWKHVWDERCEKVKFSHSKKHLPQLIELDGFDSGALAIDEAQWRFHSKYFYEKLGLHDGSSVYEVGCGAGAFLYALRELGVCTIGGSDWSGPLVKVAQSVFDNCVFECVNAEEISTTEIYDYVLANSVLQYLDIDSATRVLKKMITKSRRGILISDIPDLMFKSESEAMRREALGHVEYEAKYKEHAHTYYSKNYFREVARLHELEIEILDGVPKYVPDRFRFSAILRRNYV